MTHEPECTFLDEPKSVSGSCWCCAGIRAAYLRGRTDAAHAIRKVPVIADGPACGLISDNDAFNAAEGKYE